MLLQNSPATKISIDRLEFYITNVCNLTCGDCNRYNNYKFSGWQKWNDYKDVLEQWSKKITIKHPVILGGEPLLNPDICKWSVGIRALWPWASGVQILSNGTRLNQVPGLYRSLVHDNWIGITIHSADDRDAIFREIRKFLKHPIQETAKVNDPTLWADYAFVDSFNRKIYVWMSDIFVNSNLIPSANGTFKFFDSDPDTAHENCTFRKFKSYHMIRGKIYKCGPVALMPEFVKQHRFDLSSEDLDLLNSYKPLTVDASDEEMHDFFNTVDNVIPQCKFCPEQYTFKSIEFSNLKKSWKIMTHEDTTQ
jgi:hypothetical protein